MEYKLLFRKFRIILRLTASHSCVQCAPRTYVFIRIRPETFRFGGRGSGIYRIEFSAGLRFVLGPIVVSFSNPPSWTGLTAPSRNSSVPPRPYVVSPGELRRAPVLYVRQCALYTLSSVGRYVQCAIRRVGARAVVL